MWNRFIDLPHFIPFRMPVGIRPGLTISKAVLHFDTKTGSTIIECFKSKV